MVIEAISLAVFITAIITTVVSVFAGKFTYADQYRINRFYFLLNLLFSGFFVRAVGSGVDFKDLGYSDKEVEEAYRRIKFSFFFEAGLIKKLRLVISLFLTTFFIVIIIMVLFPTLLTVRDFVYLIIGISGLLGTLANMFYQTKFDDRP